MLNPIDVNPYTNDAFRRDPFPFLAEARANSPAMRFEHTLSRAVHIFRYDDIMSSLKDWSTFSSQFARTDEPEKMTAGKAEDTFISLDPPRHTSLRRLAQQGFLPTLLDTFRPRAEELVKKRVDHALSVDEFCLVQDFAVPITTGMITTVLGLPEEDIPLIRGWTVDLFENYLAQHFLSEVEERRMATVERITSEMTEYFRDYMAERKRSPKEGDIVSKLMTAEINGERFTEDEVLATSMLLLLAGNDSTTILISNFVNNMANFPAQADLIRKDLSLIPQAIEESVRLLPSAQALDRIATEDINLHGVDIAEGDSVILWLTSANRDSDKFENPDEFDVMRRPNRHLGFGAGIHMCIGAPLARLEANTMVTELMTRVGEIELLEPPQPGNNTIMMGPASQRVRFIAS